MKQKHADRPNWGRIIKKRYYQEYINDDHFKGYITYLLLDKVREPLNVKYDLDEICIADNGYSWIMIFPTSKFYSLTLMINREYEVLQWYFDIVKSIEITIEGIPFINDMYLDYILLPSGRLIIKDEDELNNAFNEGLITNEEYNNAVIEGEGLKESIVNKTNELLNDIDWYIEELRKYREGKFEEGNNI